MTIEDDMTTTTAPSTAETSLLSPLHLKMIQESGIKPAIAEARGYRTVGHEAELLAPRRQRNRRRRPP
jgi:hypothetical protein